MLPDRVSNPGPLTYESGALPIALRGPAVKTDRIGFSLILDVWPSSRTTKASPTVLAVGSLLPSV